MRLELAEHCARVDRVAALHRDAADAAGGGGAHLVLHLHRFDDHHGGVGRDLFAFADEHAHDATGHRRSQRATFVGASRRATDVGERGLLRRHHLDRVRATFGGGVTRVGTRRDGDEHALARADDVHADAPAGAEHGVQLERTDVDATVFAELDLVLAIVDAHAEFSGGLHSGGA